MVVTNEYLGTRPGDWFSGEFGNRQPATPRAFAEAWLAWLAAAGWPGDRALASGEFQARDAFERLVAHLASLGAVAGEMTPTQALDALRALAADTLFQPESPPAPVQIMGTLEAAGMPLDASWIVGLSADRWPPPPRPHPLLPLAWQRERGIAGATAASALAHAQALTDQLARGAPRVVASHAVSVDDHRCLPSALTAHWPVEAPGEPPLRVASSMFAARPALERVAVDRAPPIAADRPVRGGASAIEAQSECPFRALARHRLRVEPWPSIEPGLSPSERGRLMHAALAAFWRDVGTQEALAALSEADLDARIASAVDAGMATLDAARELPPLVRASEPPRMARLMRQWIDACDRARPPFRVLAVEHAQSATLGGVTLSTRIDRVDALEGGGVAIVDYKGGEVVPTRRWFEPRPAGTQLGVYALAWNDAGHEARVRAVAFAPIAAGAAKPAGVAADTSAWPALDAAPGGWPAIEAWWRDALGALARDFAAGEAAIDPRDPTVCARCGLQPLCRVDAPARDGGDDE
jgi:probable DNA repair protein